MIQAPPPPPNPVWIAVGISALGVVVTVIGWFVVNSLARKREGIRDATMRKQAATDAKARRKTEFLAFIAQVEKRATNIHITDFAKFFDGVHPNIAHWITLIEGDFTGANQTKFRELASTVCDLTTGDIYNTANKQEIMSRVKNLSEFVKGSTDN